MGGLRQLHEGRAEPSGTKPPSGKKKPVDYRELLSEDDFRVFAQLRGRAVVATGAAAQDAGGGRVSEARATITPGAGHRSENRVIRGGSWNNTVRNCRVAYRNWNPPGDRNDNLGFRLARAQAWAGWPAPDPPRHLSVVTHMGDRGEKQADAGVLVARVDARVSARRRSTYLSREEVARGR